MALVRVEAWKISWLTEGQ